MRKHSMILATLLLVGGVQPGASAEPKNIAQIPTADVRGQANVQETVRARAAIRTIKRGFDHFIVVDPAYGVTIYGTKYVQGILIRMFHAGDPAGVRAFDARALLGPDWLKKVKKG